MHLLKRKVVCTVASCALIVSSISVPSLSVGAQEVQNFAGSNIELVIGTTTVCSKDISSPMGNPIHNSMYNLDLYQVYTAEGANGYTVYGTVNNGKIDRLFIRPADNVGAVFTIPGIQATGHGDVTILASKDSKNDTLINEDRRIKLVMDAYNEGTYNGYAFVGITGTINPSDKIHFTIEDGAYREGEGSTVQVNGTIKTTSFGMTDIQNVDFGTATAPIKNAFELSYAQSTAFGGTEDWYYMLEFEDVKANAYVTESFAKGCTYMDGPNSVLQNYKLVRVQNEAELNISDKDGSTQMFDTPDAVKLQVQTGGVTTLKSDAAITKPRVQSGYYTQKGVIEQIPDDGRMQDKVNIVDCVVGDKSDAAGRYVYTVSDDSKQISITSTCKALYPLGIGNVKNGHFIIEAGTGLKNNRNEYWFEKGTEVKFTLVPDSGYQYKKGTFNFLDRYADDDDYIKKTKNPGEYIYTTEAHAVYVSCEFEPAKNEIDVDAKSVSNANISMGQNKLPGSMEFSVDDAASVSSSTQKAIQSVAGNQEIGATLDLSLNQKVETVSNEKAWVTPIKELEKTMTVSLTLDKSLSGYSDYSVVRVHDGKAEKIDATYDEKTNKLTFKTDKYSTYAIAHKKTTKVDLKKCTVTLDKTNYVYDGKEKKPKVTVKNGKKTVPSTEYTVSYSNNKKAGTAKVTIKAKSSSKTFTGTISKTFKIEKANKITIKTTSYTKTASAKVQTIELKPTATSGTVTFKSDNKNVTVSSKGKVTIAKNFSGKAIITLTAKKTNYQTVTKKVTITVNPAKVALASVSSPKSKKLKVTWKKNAYVTGYQICYSTDKNFAKNKTKTVNVESAKTLSKTIDKLSSKKTYYVRVRTYKTQSGVKYYSAWSSKKNVKVK